MSNDYHAILQVEVPIPPPRRDKLMKNWQVGDLFFAELHGPDRRAYYVLFLVDEETEAAFHVSPLFSSNGLVPLYWANGTWEKKSCQPRGLFFVT